MSPAWCSAPRGPREWPDGLECPPVLMPSPELQSPLSWMWKPCSAPGLRPDRFALTRTASPSWVKVTVPRAALPLVGSSVAAAAGLPAPIMAQPAINDGRTAAIKNLFIRASLPGSLLGGVFLRVLFFVLLPVGLRGRGLGGRGRRRGHDRRRLRHGLPGLLHVPLEVL